MVDDPLEYSRRNFVAKSGAALATLATIKNAFADTVSQLAPPSAAWRTDEGYWEKIRKKFLLEEDLAYLNNGTVGPTPTPVFDNLCAYWRLMAVNPNESFCRAYSSLPTRMRLRSSNCTSVASTFSRGRPGRARSARVRRLRIGSARANACMRSNFVSSRIARHSG